MKGKKGFYLAPGNKKYRSDKNTKYYIWSLPAVITCPNRTELCEIYCYARKAERQYPAVLPSRQNNLKLSMQSDFAEQMIAYFEKKLFRVNKHGKKVENWWIAKRKRVVVRIHESGDFYNQTYADAWIKVAEHFADYKKLVFVTYSKSFRFFDGKKLPRNFVFRASIWKDTSDSDLEIIRRNEWPIYTAYDAKTLLEKVKNHECVECTCINCTTCQKCFNNSSRNKIIAVAIH